MIAVQLAKVGWGDFGSVAHCVCISQTNLTAAQLKKCIFVNCVCGLLHASLRLGGQKTTFCWEYFWDPSFARCILQVIKISLLQESIHSPYQGYSPCYSGYSLFSVHDIILLLLYN